MKNATCLLTFIQESRSLTRPETPCVHPRTGLTGSLLTSLSDPGICNESSPYFGVTQCHTHFWLRPKLNPARISAVGPWALAQ
jgi:hypothetical protein